MVDLVSCHAALPMPIKLLRVGCRAKAANSKFPAQRQVREGQEACLLEAVCALKAWSLEQACSAQHRQVKNMLPNGHTNVMLPRQ